MDGGDWRPPKTGTQDEVGMRSRAGGRLTEVSWHLESSFLSFSVFLSPQDRLERDKHRSGHHYCF